MRAEINDYVEKIKQSIELLRRHLDWDAALRQLDELNAAAEDPDFWSNPETAQAKMR